MVDVSTKPTSKREAEASAFVAMDPQVVRALAKNPKGIRWKSRVWPGLWRLSARRS